ncbi:phosphogluconate dehydratase [Helicobacter bizzozeronii]|uniref:Phosphogluconate dehydratase n=1 Tax=Helicobacter bizzozeronii (strain CIII-1) TaxID=1002804 RepID=F8KTY8_HELBC|nr:phosphogluconate dehydratase [Helicobacter bizzozeronii]CCB80322.1 phosphogluconate dehydratase [Helicobacter bizzozeronii CIII-1]
MPKKTLEDITKSIIERSKPAREAYLERIAQYSGKIARKDLGCANLAHTYASLPEHLKDTIKDTNKPNFAIISAYNDMLSAHQPFKTYPDILKETLSKHGAIAQFAGGVPAMCDGITQGYAGMELSLFSRDVIAMGTAVALSHNVFDGAFYLGVCDKIVPGLLMGALSFGHLPAIFVPSGPMTSGISNAQKSKTRELFAQGKISRQDLLESEMQSYHSVGTCTFYGTANSNQMMVELMGLHLPNSAFINPNTPLREALIQQAATHMAQHTPKPIGQMIGAKNIVNAMVGLMATGGSTNHTIHLIAIAKMAGIILNWDDFDAISSATPLLSKIYPNGKADVNQFEAAGGLAFVVRELLEAGLLHEDCETIMGVGLKPYTQSPFLIGGKLTYQEGTKQSLNTEIVRGVKEPFSPDGGLKVLKGNIGRAVIKISAISPEHYKIQAPALVFKSQQDLIDRFNNQELQRDFIAVLPYQGPRANGMPELHKLTPILGTLQDQGFKVALITDGRMSGASGKVPAAIHVSPEALLGGHIAQIQEGDLLLLDAKEGILEVLEPKEWQNREGEPFERASVGSGRELFAGFRNLATSAETGATSFGN